MTQTSKAYLILVGIDYSTASEQALQRALEIANALANAELHVVHVVSKFDALPTDPSVSSEDMDELSIDPNAYERLQTHVAVSLGAFERQRGGTSSKPMKVITHLRTHAPAQEIAQLAADLEADLVIVGMCGRSSITRFLLGSVAENVTRLAPCPVLVYRPKGPPPEYPKIEPPCPLCVDARTASGGNEYWCAQHREKHGQRHTYHNGSRMPQDGNLPLVVQG